MTKAMDLRDNRHELVAVNVAGQVAPARIHAEVLLVDEGGRSMLLPGTGGVNLGVHTGDPVANWIADHLMPGASIEDANGEPAVAGPLHLLSCVGNGVRDGKGRRIGVVSGKRGGLAPGGWAPQLVGVEIPDTVAQTLCPHDRIVVETVGRGLRLAEWPDVELINLSPGMLDALPMQVRNGTLSCPVRAVVPATMAGAGLGQDSWIGDLEIAGDECSDGRLDGLCFGDLVAFEAIDGRVSRFYRPGVLSIGVVSHGPSHVPGHGIGVTILLSAPVEFLSGTVSQEGSVGAILRQWAEDGTAPHTRHAGGEDD